VLVIVHPLLVRHVLLPLHERLKRTPTFPWLARLERTQWLPREELLELQFARLREHVQFAYDHTVYYRRLLDDHELPPHRIQSPADFSRIPPLTRELLRQNFADLKARGARLGRVQPLATGGSTGQPVTVLVDVSVGIDLAARHRAHRWFGAEPGAREIVLWGSPIELGRQSRVRSLRDWLLNSRLLSAFDLGEPALARYTSEIERYQPEVMYGYASAFYVLARYLQRVGWRRRFPLKAIFTTAEPLLDFQRLAIESVFECPVGVEYGARDAGSLADECPQRGLHIEAESVLLETEGRTPDGLGEILVTNLYSPAMPLIRYRTGDMGELDDAACRCGRSLPLLKRVEGRRTDFLVTPTGRILHALGIIYVLREVPAVKEFQVIQEAVDRVRVELVPEPTFSDEDRETIVRRVHTLMGPDVDVQVHQTDSIQRAASGKFRYVISHVADAHLEGLLAGESGTTAHRAG
jgi:phenylacetate-CoA ligase